MLKFFLLLIVFFLAVRLALRLFKGLFFTSSSNTYRSRAPFQRAERVEEADFEVIDTQLGNTDKRRDVA